MRGGAAMPRTSTTCCWAAVSGVGLADGAGPVGAENSVLSEIGELWWCVCERMALEVPSNTVTSITSIVRSVWSVWSVWSVSMNPARLV